MRDLPHGLVRAFRATLEETADADLLLHVVDAASPERDDQIAQVERVLEEIGAGSVPQWQVWNKIDLLDLQPRVDWEPCGTVSRLFVSARSGLGLPQLREALVQAVGRPHASDADLAAQFGSSADPVSESP